ncbi:2-succinyl-6-hydroxy-2,4-cyclohexadiene-1-carboxylate synthase [Bacillus massiliigorillae]|uniref:2-succinyl-6-hydroxy-2, 4-cyclohexadiene-1-carboxylate synthase n=1 Tax=Bacillus massiliigorillae TaxID=1243664 RepID=UPI0003AA7E74|nr:2-succinyl-6-hydroxy-2,4-cyclohexadiene-1-carboxylate synthase [Bacillus massiliigorillae]
MNIQCNDISYHVEIVGQGEPLLLLHGFTGDYSTWKETIQSLSKRYMCIMPDIIGHGQTDHPNTKQRYAIEEVANDLRNILQTLKITKAHVLGYSMGGRLALTFAILHHEWVQTLILESASPGLATEVERLSRRQSDGALAERIIREGMAKFVDYWQGIPLFESQRLLAKDVREKIKNQRLTNSEIGLANSLLGMGTGSQPSWWDDIDSITNPVLLVTGEFDEKYCRIANEMKQRIENCDWQVVKQVGHAIHVENPEKFGKIVSEFVEKWRV